MSTPDKIELKIDGMDCAGCALGIEAALKKVGVRKVTVSYSTSSALVDPEESNKLSKIIEQIEKLGYHIIDPENSRVVKATLTLEHKFILCLLLTLPILAGMFFGHFGSKHGYFELALSTPIFLIGLEHFGKSAWRSLRSGVPNMDVLIIIGVIAAYFYSIAGLLLGLGADYLFFETAATIVTIVLFGNLLERRSVKRTSTAIEELYKLQPRKAKLILPGIGKESISEVEISAVNVGDRILINSGDKIPADGEIYWGEASLDESMISGESLPVEKKTGAKVIGGTVVISGSIKITSTAIGSSTVLAQMIKLVRDAQASKPSLQRIADRVSSIFVPVVTLIALSTFFLEFLFFDYTFQEALLNTIAVLVIACPCAMGLATPTAVMVGVGLAAKRGILLRGGETLERVASLKAIVFDKTGTLTYGEFKLAEIVTFGLQLDYLKSLIVTLERHSSHPIARSLINDLPTVQPLDGINVLEHPGSGISARDNTGNLFRLGSYSIAQDITKDESFDLYLLKNQELIAGLKIFDKIKTEAAPTIKELIRSGINVAILSGDTVSKCQAVGNEVGITNIYAKKLPQQKLELITELSNKAPTGFVGDGINDAASLTRATVGISLSGASEVALQSAQVVLLGGNLGRLIDLIKISKLTIKTIKQNLFWAFLYNVLAIPLAALGYLTPTIGALAMAFSDLFVIGNSLRIRWLGLRDN